MDKVLKLSSRCGGKEALSSKDVVIRSPCDDAHYEAFILQSRWAVGNLYASNLNLGQTYMKRIADMEKQRKLWLKRKEMEQKKMLDRMERLSKAQQTKKSFILNRADGEQSKRNGDGENNYKLEIISSRSKLALSVSPHQSLEKSLTVNPTNQPSLITRSLSESSKTSPPFPASKSVDSQTPDRQRFLSSRIRSETVVFGKVRTMSTPQLRQRSTSLGQNQVKKQFACRSKILRDDDELVANPNLKPKWLPTRIRSQTREKILFEMF